jgi:hypothetical protein
VSLFSRSDDPVDVCLDFLLLLLREWVVPFAKAGLPSPVLQHEKADHCDEMCQKKCLKITQEKKKSGRKSKVEWCLWVERKSIFLFLLSSSKVHDPG